MCVCVKRKPHKFAGIIDSRIRYPRINIVFKIPPSGTNVLSCFKRMFKYILWAIILFAVNNHEIQEN